MENEFFHSILRALWFNTPEAVLVIDVEGCITHCNNQITPILGWKPVELIEQRVEVLIPSDRQQMHVSHREKYQQNPFPRKMGEKGSALLQAKKKDGSVAPVDISLSRIHYQDQSSTLVIIRDAMDRFEYEERLRFLSSHDALTGLYDRGYLEEALDRMEREVEGVIGIIAADIDELKKVNDTFGHEAGDQHIRRAARILADAAPRDAVVARFGGDEFVLIIPGTDAEGLGEVVARIAQGCEAWRETPRLGISVGVGLSTQGEGLRATFRRADEKMYQMKKYRK